MKSLLLLFTISMYSVSGLQTWNLFPNFDMVPEPTIEVIESGEGPLIVQGSSVTIHFELFDEKGEKVESTRDREEPFTMPAGIRFIQLQGFDDHILEMRKGERVLLTLPPELAFGKSSVRGKPNAGLKDQTITVDIEILDWTPPVKEEL